MRRDLSIITDQVCGLKSGRNEPYLEVMSLSSNCKKQIAFLLHYVSILLYFFSHYYV